MAYHKATQQRYYQKKKKELNKKQSERQRKARALAKLAIQAGLKLPPEGEQRSIALDENTPLTPAE
jgi:hypothetical protein